MTISRYMLLAAIPITALAAAAVALAVLLGSQTPADWTVGYAAQIKPGFWSLRIAAPGRGLDVDPLPGQDFAGWAGVNTDASLSPDGRYLAWSSSGIVMVYDFDTQGIDRLLPGGSVSWSPNSTDLAFTYRNQVIVMGNKDTPTFNRLHRFTPASINDVREPRWSPDGKTLVYEIFLANQRQTYAVSSDGADRINLMPEGAEAYDADWSPDGSRLALVSSLDGNPEIYIVAADGAESQRVTFNPGSDDLQPAYSPDGARVAYVSVQQGRIGVYITDIETGAITGPLAELRASGYALRNAFSQPVWSPDGRMLVFGSVANGVSCVFVVRADGTGLRRLNAAQTEAVLLR
jgi:Tol biopolymer transport system component